MPILMPFLKLAYYPIPKVACTSMKHAIFKINNEIDYKEVNFANKRKATGPAGRKRNKCQIHSIYKTEIFSLESYEALGDYRKITLVRDPISRILSAYSNRVLSKSVLNKQRTQRQLEKAGLPLQPSLDEFVLNIAGYRKASSAIQSHTRPIRRFLGDDLGRFDRIFRLSDMPELEAFLSQEIGHEISVPQEQASDIKFTLDDLSDESFELLRDFCRLDYELLADYYPVPQREPSETA
ncbi:MAG: sulfotransferase family 2 domain-containing protein [Sedimenticolaceae bacterium]